MISSCWGRKRRRGTAPDGGETTTTTATTTTRAAAAAEEATATYTGAAASPAPTTPGGGGSTDGGTPRAAAGDDDDDDPRARRRRDRHKRLTARRMGSSSAAARIESASSSVVGRFLSRVGPGTLLRYRTALEEEGFDTLEALQTLTEDDLEDLGVRPGHRRVLLPALRRLKEACQEREHEDAVEAQARADAIANSASPHRAGRVTYVGSPSAPPLPLAGPGAGGSGSPSRQHKVSDRVAAFLRRLPGNNMEVYGALLARDGFDSLESMCLMDDEDVLAIVPPHKAGHLKVFQRALARLRASMVDERGETAVGTMRDDDDGPASALVTRGTMGRTTTSGGGGGRNGTLPAGGAAGLAQPHVYVLSGRDRVATHMKRHIGDGKYSRWDVFEQTAERYNYVTDSWASVPIDPCWGAGTACGDGHGHLFSLTGLGWSPTDGLVDMPLPSVPGRTWGAATWVGGGLPDARGGGGAAGVGGDGVETAGMFRNHSSASLARRGGRVLGNSAGRPLTTNDASGLVFAAGGFKQGAGLTQVVDVYDVARGTWSNVNPLRTPRHSLALAGTPFGGPGGNKRTVYAVGGGGMGLPKIRSSSSSNVNANAHAAGKKPSVSGRSALAVVEAYDVGADRWTRLGRDMSIPRLGCAALCTERGCLHVVGGANSSSKALRAMEFYDPRVGKWASLRPMIQGRSFFGAVRLPTGDIMCVGGKKHQQWITSAEIFDARQGLWRVAASLARPRHAVPHTTYRGGTAGSGRRPRGYSVAVA